MIISRKMFQILVGTVFGGAIAAAGIKSVLAPPKVTLDMSTLQIIDATSKDDEDDEEDDGQVVDITKIKKRKKK